MLKPCTQAVPPGAFTSVDAAVRESGAIDAGVVGEPVAVVGRTRAEVDCSLEWPCVDNCGGDVLLRGDDDATSIVLGSCIGTSCCMRCDAPANRSVMVIDARLRARPERFEGEPAKFDALGEVCEIQAQK